MQVCADHSSLPNKVECKLLNLFINFFIIIIFLFPCYDISEQSNVLRCKSYKSWKITAKGVYQGKLSIK